MNKSTNWGHIILLVICWIIFVGLCIDAGALITNAVIAMVKPGAVKFLWQQVDLTSLFQYDIGHFIVQVSIIAIATVLKAILFYLIIKNLHEKKLNLAQPFNQHARQLVVILAWVALGISWFSASGIGYSEWLTKQGVDMPDTQLMRLGGADVWLFMCVILFVIAHIFKKGIEIQTENDLTV
jgi:hypothetical protein